MATFYEALEGLYYQLSPGTYCLTVYANFGLTMDIYRYKDLTITSGTNMQTLFSRCTYDNSRPQCLIVDNLTVNYTLQPPHTCMGLWIFANNFVNNSGIYMSQRGCSCSGDDLLLYSDDKIGNQIVPAYGAVGGAGFTTPAYSYQQGNSGSNGVNRQSGGGGTGVGSKWFGTAAVVRPGGRGTSYSGGTGSGAVHSHANNNWVYGGYPSDSGGLGGYSICQQTSGSWWDFAGGGAGNPAGGSASNKGLPTVYGGVGTGGLIVIFSENFTNNGSIYSNGSNGCWASMGKNNVHNCPGGASGGGSINIFYRFLHRAGYVSAAGGSSSSGWADGWHYSGSGGAGCVTFTQLMARAYLFLDDNIKTFKSNWWQTL